MARAHINAITHAGVYPILSRDYQFNYNQYATVLILSTCISPLSYMKDNVEKLHGFSFCYEAYGLLFNEQKYPKVSFSLNDFWYSVYVRSQRVIILCEITRYFILGVLKFLLPFYNFIVNVSFYAAVRMF